MPLQVGDEVMAGVQCNQQVTAVRFLEEGAAAAPAAVDALGVLYFSFLCLVDEFVVFALARVFLSLFSLLAYLFSNFFLLLLLN